jgi:nucleotide-binding universal stress UspA family protein
MTYTLIVPLDGDPVAAIALPVVRTLARATDASIVLLTVVRDEAPERRDEARSYLERTAAGPIEEGFRVETVTRVGSPPDEIVAEADSYPSGFVVMATHGRSGIPRAVLGSVAQHVVAHSPFPVLLVRPGCRTEDSLRRIVVPVDGTPGSLLALGAATVLAQQTGAQLILLQVVVPLPLWIYEPTLGLDTGPLINPMWNEDARIAAEQYVEAIAARLKKQAAVDVESRAAVGGVAGVVKATVDDVGAELVVMSTHGLTGPARALLGSVADEVVRTVDCPVLLVRRRPEPAEPPEFMPTLARTI